MSIDPASLVRPRRVITGMSAILLPMKADLTVDWEGFAAHVARTSAAGITPAINMDTGYVQLIDDATRRETLRIARDAVGPNGKLVAGACVVDEPGAAFDEAAYGRQIEMIVATMGVGARRAMAHGSAASPVVVYEFADGRCGIVNHLPWSGFAIDAMNRDGKGAGVAIQADFWVGFVDGLLRFFDTGVSVVPKAETCQAIAMVEAGRKALASPGTWVELA
jgi:hypothetical protein